MLISSTEKNEIRELMRSKEYLIAQRKLFRLCNSKLETVTDICFAKYNLAWILKKIGELDMSKIYISDLKEYILDIEDENKYISETYSILWLYIELYKEELTKEELITNYVLIRDKVLYIGEDEIVMGLNITIDMLKGKYDEVLKNFIFSLEKGYIDTVNNTLESLQKENKYIYEMALLHKTKFEETKVINVL